MSNLLLYAEPLAYDITGLDHYLGGDNRYLDETGDPILDEGGDYIYLEQLHRVMVASPRGLFVEGVDSSDNILRDETGDPILDENGDYIFTDVPALVHREMIADTGGVTVSGLAISVQAIRTMAAAPALHTISGWAADLQAATSPNPEMVASSVPLAVTGADTALTRAVSLSADAGSHAVTGALTTLQYGKTLLTDAGSLSLSGAAATLAPGTAGILIAEFGEYRATGADFQARRTLIAPLAAGRILLRGADAMLGPHWQDSDSVLYFCRDKSQVVFSVQRIRAAFYRPQTVVEFRNEAPQMSAFSKQPYEEYTISVDFSRNLARGESITSQEVVAYDVNGSDVTLTVTNQASLAVNRGRVSIMIRSGSVLASPYKLTFRCGTSLNHKWEHDVQMTVEEI